MGKGSEAEGGGPPRSKRHGLAGLVFGLLALLRGVVYLLGIAWAVGAVWYDGPAARDGGNAYLAAGFAVVALLFLAGLRKPWRRFLGWTLLMAAVVVPWSLIAPSNERNWQPQWRRTAWAKIDGDSITFKNFRNFDYALDGTVTQRWEDRTVHLSKLQGLAYFHHEIGGKILSHPVLSFDFGEDGHVAFSVESRRERGEKFSPLAGLYKQYELIYLAGDERDFIRERATIREEPVRLYASSYSPLGIREMFLETVRVMNDLRKKPRFYNSVTANCTTSYLAQAPLKNRVPLDYRMLFNGRIESLLYERGVLVADGLPLDELKERATINEAARAAHRDPEFSARIREGRPGF